MMKARQRKQTDQVDVRYFALPDDLAPFFTSIYRCRMRAPAGQSIVDALLPEWANLRFFTGAPPRVRSTRDGKIIETHFGVTGPSSQPLHFDIASTSMWGIGLFPLGWARFVGAPAEDYADTVVDGYQHELFARLVPLADMLRNSSASDEQQFEEIVETFRQFPPLVRDAARIARIHEAMLDPYLVDVGELAEKVGLTKRTLERTCGKYFGFPPRFLLRRQRIMRSLSAFMLSEGKSWTETIDRHYHDQAHFVHEFHAFMGMSPSEFIALDHPIIEAIIVERQRIWGLPANAPDAGRSVAESETGV